MFVFFIMYMCICLCLGMCLWLQMPMEVRGLRSPGAGVRYLWANPHMCWVWNPALFLLTVEQVFDALTHLPSHRRYDSVYIHCVYETQLQAVTPELKNLGLSRWGDSYLKQQPLRYWCRECVQQTWYQQGQLCLQTRLLTKESVY